MNPYTADWIRTSLAAKYDTYYAKLCVGQMPTWSCDQRTKDLFCLGQWLMDELFLLKCTSVDRRDTQDFFNRKARAENDLFELAALAMNNLLEGKVERFRRRERK